MADNDTELARGLALLAAEVDTPDVDVTAVIVAVRARDRRRTSVIAAFAAVVAVGLVTAVIGFAGPRDADHAATTPASPAPPSGSRFAAQLTAAWPGIAPPGTRTTVIGRDDDHDPHTIPMRLVAGTGYQARLKLTDAEGSTEVTITVEPDPAPMPPAPRCGPVDGCAFRTFVDGTAATVTVDGSGNRFEAQLRDRVYVTVLEQAQTRHGFLLGTDRMFRMATVFTTPR